MANKRDYSLEYAAQDRTGYSIKIDKSGNSEAVRILYEYLLADAVAAAAPVSTTLEITSGAGSTITESIAKRIQNDKLNVLQLKFTFEETESFAIGDAIDIIIDEVLTGCANQSVSVTCEYLTNIGTVLGYIKTVGASSTTISFDTPITIAATNVATITITGTLIGT